MKDLIRKCLSTQKMELLDVEKYNFGSTAIYFIETSGLRLKVWNSSNNKNFHHETVLSEIVEDFLEKGIKRGSVSYNFCDIMFEVDEI